MPPKGHDLPHRPHLFKLGRKNTGENWSERACFEIAKALNLPCAKYEFAVSGEERGVISENFLPIGARLYLGNLLLSRIVTRYDGAKHFKQIDYKLSTVLNIIRRRIPGMRGPMTRWSAILTGITRTGALLGRTRRTEYPSYPDFRPCVVTRPK
jgi:hypothetical protein